MKKHKYEASYTEHNYENWLVYLHFESDNDTQAKRYATIMGARLSQRERK